MPEQRPDDCLKVDPAVGIGRDKRSRRQCAVRRIGDDTKRREGNPVLGRNPRGEMGFHVDGDRTCFFVKSPLCVGGHDRNVGPHNIAE